MSQQSAATAAGAAVNQEETPTVVPDSGLKSLQYSSASEEEDTDPTADLRGRAASTERIIKQMQTDEFVKNGLLGMAPPAFHTDEGEAILFNIELWDTIHEEIIDGIFLCMATSKKDVDAASKNYMHKTFEIDVLASLLVDNFPESMKKTLSDSDCRKASLLLQLLCRKFIDTFHEMIVYPSRGDNLTITEAVQSQVEIALREGTTALFPKPNTKNNAYYIIGFLGHQAEKEAKRRAKDSGVKAYLTYIAHNRFLVRRRGEKDIGVINVLVADIEMPTEMVEKRETLGGLHYADRICWEFFAIIEHIYSTLATPKNFLRRGGKLLREICDAILSNNELSKRFATLCGHNDKSTFTMDDSTICFEYFLKVFGRVRGKDVALKYNSAVYDRKNTVALRAKLAALSGQNKKAKPAAKKQKTSDAKGDEAISEEDHHRAIVEDLDRMDEESAEDANTGKVLSAVVEKMIENDTPKD